MACPCVSRSDRGNISLSGNRERGFRRRSCLVQCDFFLADSGALSPVRKGTTRGNSGCGGRLVLGYRSSITGDALAALGNVSLCSGADVCIPDDAKVSAARPDWQTGSGAA
jgi:hypothetical protein